MKITDSVAGKQAYNNRPAFSGTFVKNENLKNYIDRMNRDEFDSFVKNHRMMEKVNDGKEYRYEIESYRDRKYGCIIDENGEYLEREMIDAKDVNIQKDYFKNSEDCLFSSVFSRYARKCLTEAKKSFWVTLPNEKNN